MATRSIKSKQISTSFLKKSNVYKITCFSSINIQTYLPVKSTTLTIQTAV